MEICVERKDWHRTFIAVINKGHSRLFSRNCVLIYELQSPRRNCGRYGCGLGKMALGSDTNKST